MNLTLTALVASHLASSPMLMFSQHFHEISTINIDRFSTRNFFSSFLYSQSYQGKVKISKSSFIRYMRTPLVFRSSAIPCRFDNYTNQTALECQAQFTQKGFDAYVLDCNFEGHHLEGSDSGGAIFFGCELGSLIVFGTFFKSFTGNEGGAIFAAAEWSAPAVDPFRRDCLKFHSHYCCYSSCSAREYGSAALVAAQDLQLNYSSTLNCPGSGFTSTKGAQFDLHSKGEYSSIASSNINSTTGRSIFCASLEYRQAESGFFKFQTIVNQVGGFITSFTSLNADVDISYCNIVNVTVTTGLEKGAPPGVIHIRKKAITIDHFFFYGITFQNKNDKLITCQRGDTLVATLRNSVAEVETSQLAGVRYDEVDIIDPGTDAERRTQGITQLFLGDCRGVMPKTPPPIVPPPTPYATYTPAQSLSRSPTETPAATQSPSAAASRSRSPAQTDVPEQTDAYSETAGIPLIGPDSTTKEKGGPNIPLIAGIAGGAAAAVAAAALAAFFLIRRHRMNLIDDDINLQETNDTEFNQQNPLYNKAPDDPFQDDFIRSVEAE